MPPEGRRRTFKNVNVIQTWIWNWSDTRKYIWVLQWKIVLFISPPPLKVVTSVFVIYRAIQFRCDMSFVRNVDLHYSNGNLPATWTWLYNWIFRRCSSHRPPFIQEPIQCNTRPVPVQRFFVVELSKKTKITSTFRFTFLNLYEKNIHNK